MCLVNRKSDVVRFLKENEGKEFIKVYKRVRLCTDSGSFTIKLCAPTRTYIYSAGEHDFRGEIKHNNRMRNNADVHAGFHCWLDYNSAKRSGYGTKTVPFYVKPEDVLGVEKTHAVFKRAILLKNDHDKALGVTK